MTPKGTRYDAFDNALMLWTVAVIADSAQRFYELFIRELSPGERELLWQDYLRFGELFGMQRDICPRTYDGFRCYWDARLSSEYMHLTDEARYIGYATAFEIPMPRSHQPGKRVHDAIMLGSLPATVREHYGLGYGARQQLEFRAAVRALSTARRAAPKLIAQGRNTRSFDMVAATERRRIERGQPTPQVKGARSGPPPAQPTTATPPGAREQRAA
jgi:uncharacterized protein (DUF2236 family)